MKFTKFTNFTRRLYLSDQAGLVMAYALDQLRGERPFRGIELQSAVAADAGDRGR